MTDIETLKDILHREQLKEDEKFLEKQQFHF